MVLLVALLLVLSVTVDRVLRSRTEGQLEQRLLDRVAVAQALADQVSAQDLVDRIGGEGVSVRLTTGDGEVLTAGPQAAAPSPSATPGGPAPKPGPAAPDRVRRSGDVYSVERRLPVGELVLTTDAGGLRQTLSQVRVVLALSSLGVLVLAALLVGLLTGRLLRPLDTMTTTARSIAAGDRGRRLRPDPPDTELGRMAGAFDDMLDAVEGAEGRARAAEARVRDFVLEAAHELRTPLAGVQASAEALLLGHPGREERERLLAGVVRESQRAGRLADDLLLMARIDRGVELERGPVDLRLLAEDVAATATRRPGAAVSVGSAHGPSVVEADADRVTQVLTNLVDNARRATGPDGRVRLEVGPGGRVVVADDGPGVPAADRERIFERLVRLDAARSRDRGGAGLGLPIARGLARAHGGDLRLLDTGTGAAFELTLP
ncbi:HAMP domain-containing histidine kinase [Phycicoccus sp. MQZ13P-5]|uniref:histidine kinase n=2 Tax=Phycicoccus sonneratiae TaxID=2807628 RepID=A0ABS2CLP4_9MICO|nr:HAMP domain-containing histidine kinase [Phycicoccus sonneraticus]